MAEFEREQRSGLAGEITSTAISGHYDLGGYNEARSKELMRASFSKPLTAPTEMIKITLVCGGGKLVRSRYSDDLPKWLVSALREIGFSEDRSAAETFDSQGTFKQQHDTGQNLKYLIVYPYVACATQRDAGDNYTHEEPVDVKSPEYIVGACELSTLLEIVPSEAASYRQKKQLLQVLHLKAEEFNAIEAKLVAGSALTVTEQEVYDANSGSDTEKIAWVQQEIKRMVDDGNLTASEKADLLSSMLTKIDGIDAEIVAAKKVLTAEKKVSILEKRKENILARKKFVEEIEPVQHRLRMSNQIQAQYKKLLPLQALEDKGRSMSLTLADLKKLEPKPDIENTILQLEQSSRGWFVEDADFQQMCLFERQQAIKTHNTVCGKTLISGTKKGGNSSIGSTRGTNSIGGSWSTATAKKGAAGSSSGPGGAFRKPANGFAAAFDGSDSDD